MSKHFLGRADAYPVVDRVYDLAGPFATFETLVLLNLVALFHLSCFYWKTLTITRTTAFFKINHTYGYQAT